MREIETDYLVVGAGASGIGIVDALIAEADVDVVIVDRRHRPGGHWLDAYPFVRLHQPSANYGVNSRVLGTNRVDVAGPNAGFYERATAAEICDYYNRVLEEVLLASGRVRFFGMSDYRGQDANGHHFVSLLGGEETTVKVRRKLVDATYVESRIPSRHAPSYEIDAGARVIPPNDLVRLSVPASGYTVIGAGKTAMDTCNWLLDEGVEPDAIRWIRPRDGWMFDRAAWQPLDQVGSYMQLQARWVQAAAEASSASDFALRLEEKGIFVRIDPNVEPEFFKGPILSAGELASLRRIANVVRLGRVRRIGTDEVELERGSIPSDTREVYVDCTAEGTPVTELRPVFEPDRITMQYITIGIVPYSAATIGAVEGLIEDDAEKNRLCPPLTFTGNVSDLPTLAHSGMSGQVARTLDPLIGPWSERSRLNPAGGANDHLDDPRIPSAFATIGASFGPAMENLARLAGVSASV